MARILVIDDDELIRNSLSRCFTDMGHAVLLAGSLSDGIAQAETGVDIIYLDLNLPDGDGHEAINELSATSTHPEIIVITGLRDSDGAHKILDSGAWDYIQKPATPSSIKASLTSALNYRENRSSDMESPPSFNKCGIIGSDSSMERARQLMSRAAKSEASVLILGETGVGKELAAHAIHANSPRKTNAFVTVDCSNLTATLLESILYGHKKGSFTGAHSDHKGLVAEANGGTLFLDEIGELPPSLQKSFLRVLQEHRYRPVGSTREETSDFRLVAATNRNLEAMTKVGTFRSDLLFRLCTVEVSLPALRDRGNDLTELAAHFTKKACDRYGFGSKKLSKQLIKILKDYAWPGNVRELSNVMEAAVIETGHDPVVYPKHLPTHIRVSYLNKDKKKHQAPKQPSNRENNSPLTYGEYKAIRDQAYFQHLMEICEYDVTKASQHAELSVPSIYRHLGLAGISTKNKTNSTTM